MQPLAEQIYEEIEQTLRAYRLSRWVCADGDGHYPLTDHLTPDGESIQSGYDEIRMICDAIYNRVLTRHFISAEKTPDKLIEETWDAMPDGQSGFLKTWGFIQFGRALIAKVVPRQTTRKPRAWMRLGRTGESTGVTDNEYSRDQWHRVESRVIPLYTEVSDEIDRTDLLEVYAVETASELLTRMEKHISKLQSELDAAREDTRCYAPSCGKWDGNQECTCRREKNLQNSD